MKGILSTKTVGFQKKKVFTTIDRGFVQARSQDLEKGGGYFEKVRKVQTTLTRIFIVLESVSHGFSENQGGISQKSRNFKHFICPNSGDLQKKK